MKATGQKKKPNHSKNTRAFVEPKDSAGRPLSPGDCVRIINLPDMSQMSAKAREESLPVFHYLKGKYKRIYSFNQIGWAEIEFRIRKGKLAGLHTVWIEPSLLRRKS